MIEEQSITGKGKTKSLLSEINSDNICDFACEKSSVIFKLAPIFEKEMKEVNAQYERLERLENL